MGGLPAIDFAMNLFDIIENCPEDKVIQALSASTIISLYSIFVGFTVAGFLSALSLGILLPFLIGLFISQLTAILLAQPSIAQICGSPEEA